MFLSILIALKIRNVIVFQIGSAVETLGAGYYCSSGLCVPARCNTSSTTAPQKQCQSGRGITNFCCPFNLDCARDWMTLTDSSATMNRCLRDGWGAGEQGCQCPNGYKRVNDPALSCKCFLQCNDSERCDYEQPSKQPPTCCWKNIDNFWKSANFCTTVLWSNFVSDDLLKIQNWSNFCRSNIIFQFFSVTLKSLIFTRSIHQQWNGTSTMWCWFGYVFWRRRPGEVRRDDPKRSGKRK